MASMVFPSSTSLSSLPSYSFPRHAVIPRRTTFPQNKVRCVRGESAINQNNPYLPILKIDQISSKTLLQVKPMVTDKNINSSSLKIFSGSANVPLAKEIAQYLGVDLGKLHRKRFADGEIYVDFQESVRGCDVYLVQPTSPPGAENIMELLLMIQACKRASAQTVTAVIPYFGYARADKMNKLRREAFTAKLVPDLLQVAGADRVIPCDLHSDQSLGYFSNAVDHITCEPVILDYLASKMIHSNDWVVVSPDAGGTTRATNFASKISKDPIAMIEKRREGHNVCKAMKLIGDVKGKYAVMFDDMIDTAGTITNGAILLREHGAKEVIACCTHAVFSPPAIERLSSGLFEEVIVTNTIPVLEKNYFPQLTVLSVANLLGETIWRVHCGESVSSIFR